jgi:hypothetical protein
MTDLADSALQRGEVDEAARLCDLALVLMRRSPDDFQGLLNQPPIAKVLSWTTTSVEALAVRGSVEECRGGLLAARRYDDRAMELVDTYGSAYPVACHRRHVLRLLKGSVSGSPQQGPEKAARELGTLLMRYIQAYGDDGLSLFYRRKSEGWVRAVRECAAALRGDDSFSGSPRDAVLVKRMEGEAAEIEGIFDALKAAALAEARAAVAQERASRQQAPPSSPRARRRGHGRGRRERRSSRGAGPRGTRRVPLPLLLLPRPRWVRGTRRRARRRGRGRWKRCLCRLRSPRRTPRLR